MLQIKIVQHKSPVPVNDSGDILYPFDSWSTTLTAGGWYSKFPEEFYTDKLYYPLTAISQNPWTALDLLQVDFKHFQKQVEYKCPYNKYIHYWCLPVLVFTTDVRIWTARYNTDRSDMYLDAAKMRKFNPPKVKNALPYSKIQRALLGSGYTETTLATDGSVYLYDTILALDNGDFLGSKVWLWFNR